MGAAACPCLVRAYVHVQKNVKFKGVHWFLYVTVQTNLTMAYGALCFQDIQQMELNKRKEDAPMNGFL